MHVSRIDIVVILVCLVAGYFLMSWVLGRLKSGGRVNAKPVSGSGQGYWRDRGPAPPARPLEPDNVPKPWYEVLQVPAYASLDEVKLAYRRRVAEYHPDKTSGLGDDLRKLAEEKTKQINVAYKQALRAFGQSS